MIPVLVSVLFMYDFLAMNFREGHFIQHKLHALVLTLVELNCTFIVSHFGAIIVSALIHHAISAPVRMHFQPSGVHFGGSV